MPAHTPLADGSYPVATNLSQARSAAKPAGIEWDYPRGLNLYGQLRVHDATGDTNTLDFVLTHNLIVARYYAWLMNLTNTLASASQLAKFQTTNAVLGPFFQLGKLDNCGSMTQQLLEGALRHGGGPTIQQFQMAMVTANYISAGQTRLPDGTLYRAADQNAVVNTNGQSVATDANASFSFFRLSSSAPRFPPAPLTYETESLAITTNGATAAIVTNAGVSGGKYVSFNSAAAGNSVTFVLTNVPAGVYDLELSFRAVANCGTLTLAAAS
jgi:hypothetical protein